MDKKKQAAAAAVAVAAAAGMVTGAVFDNPGDIVPEAEPIVEFNLSDDDGGGAPAPEERQKGVAAKIREWILRLPVAVRMLVAVPLWCFGSLLLSALSVVWMATGPILSRLLGWGALALVLLAVFGLSVKAAFPDVPLRKILRPGNVLLLLGMSAVLFAAEQALPMVWEGYNSATGLVWRIGAICLLAFTCCMELKIQGKIAARKLRAEREALAPQRTEVELEARRLADSVCPPRF